MSELLLRPVIPDNSYDLDLLARLNRRLTKDEHSANEMSVAQLRGRLQTWLKADYHAVLFEYSSSSAGYTVYRFQDETFRSQRVVYVRQFFVEQAYRRQGVGHEAFAQLRRNYFGEARVVLEVLTANPSGLAFWRSLGFEPYAVTLELV